MANDMENNNEISSTQLEENFEGASYPADKEHLIQTARQNDAPAHIVMFLEQIPPDRLFNEPDEVMEMLIIETDQE
jgi:hypothetical protein